ncbi:MAG: beta-N-acetylhexosaminidase [Alphaproteobacteria bacterium]|nr:beta-N-acetylhexosaminidase [Alphaproteobacteria bacterium]
MPAPHAVIVGCAGTALSADEATVLAQYPPMGCILFARNIRNPAQVRTLIADLKTAAGWDLPIWIDQEGGRVQRFKPPHWAVFPAMAHFGQCFTEDAARGKRLLDTATRLLAGDLRGLGVDVDCHPVLDLLYPETHAVIGNRAFASDAETVVACGGVLIEALKSSGVVPIMKHFPGHGRAESDSHLELPSVHAEWADLLVHDLAPFIALKNTPMVMTAHIVYPAWDHLPATLSSRILRDWWRNEMDYDGLIVSDDLAMYALSGFGSSAELATQTLTAGADLALYCTGDLAQNVTLLAATPAITTQGWQRWQACEDIRRRPVLPPDAAARAEYQNWVQQHDFGS